MCNALAFTFEHCESQKRSWECARAFWRIAKNEFKKCLFFWKCSIFTRCLNRVGCEFWDLSRNHKGHVSAVKCRRIFDLISGTPPFSNLSFCPSWPVCHLREHFYMCSTNPSHTLTRVFATYSSTLPPRSLPSFFPLLLFLLLWCVCPPSPPLCLKCGATALRLASRHGHTATVELLKSWGK